jgi:hypothetical protein
VGYPAGNRPAVHPAAGGVDAPVNIRNRYDREDRSVDEQDACSVARWLKETCERNLIEKYLKPPLTDEERQIAMLEGWILGIA